MSADATARSSSKRKVMRRGRSLKKFINYDTPEKVLILRANGRPCFFWFDRLKGAGYKFKYINVLYFECCVRLR
jgi:hypothetical protein